MTQTQNQTSAATKKISTYITLIVLIVVALAVIALILAASLYYTAQPRRAQPNQATNRRRNLRGHRFNRFNHVNIHTLPVKEANQQK